jgi:hypothetical protein
MKFLKSQGNIRIPTRLIEEGCVGSFANAVFRLLIDLPSVDKEKDEGKLLAQSLWNVTDVNQLNADARLNATITEMILLRIHRRLVIY